MSSTPVADIIRQGLQIPLVPRFDHITPKQVALSLSKTQRDLNDFIHLISPAAQAYLEPMAQQAHQLSKQRFGSTVQFYIPLYLSNFCINECSYCGFSINQKIRRKVLNFDEIQAEVEAILAKGFRHLLLVTGEAPARAGTQYLKKVIQLLRPQFAHLALEAQPMNQIDYEILIRAGLDSVLVYQETYHQATYAQTHLKGPKQDFHYRLETTDRLGQAGIEQIGIGCLLGLSSDWRHDAYHTATHLQALEKIYWKTRYSLSFPRIRPHAGQHKPAIELGEKDLVQLICAYRLCFPQVELSLSTRESAQLRDRAYLFGITHMSAESSTQPGGYAQPNHDLAQFEIDDQRNAQQIQQTIQQQGYQVIWQNHHDWKNKHQDLRSVYPSNATPKTL